MKNELDQFIEEIYETRRKIWERANNDPEEVLRRFYADPEIQKWLERNKRACARAKIREGERELAALK